MSRSSRSGAGLAMLLPIVLATQLPESRQASSPVARIHLLLQAAFPELDVPTMDVRIQIKGTFAFLERGSFTVVLMPDGKLPQRPEEQFLGGIVDLPPDQDYIESAMFRGQYLSTPVIEKFMYDAETWSDADIAAALVQAGARYGPQNGREFAALLNIARYERALGKVLKTHTEFSWDKARGRAAFPWGWAVALETAGTHGRNCYTRLFEPINGRLSRLGGRACK